MKFPATAPGYQLTPTAMEESIEADVRAAALDEARQIVLRHQPLGRIYPNAFEVLVRCNCGAAASELSFMRHVADQLG